MAENEFELSYFFASKVKYQMQRMDYEIYKPPMWQYQVYYILFGVYVVICSLLLYLWQKKIRDADRAIIVWGLHIIWVLFFILGWIIAI